jgi:hypothetical protein
MNDFLAMYDLVGRAFVAGFLASDEVMNGSTVDKQPSDNDRESFNFFVDASIARFLKEEYNARRD